MKSLVVKSWIAVIAMCAVVITAGISIYLDVWRIDVISTAVATEFEQYDPEVISSIDTMSGLFSFAYWGSWILGVLLFASWLKAGKANIRAVRMPHVGIHTSDSYVFSMPFSAMTDLIKTSAHHAGPVRDGNWQAEPVPMVLRPWMIVLVAMVALDATAYWLWKGADELDPIVLASWASLCAESVTIVACVLSGWLVWHVTALQEAGRSKPMQQPYPVPEGAAAMFMHGLTPGVAAPVHNPNGAAATLSNPRPPLKVASVPVQPRRSAPVATAAGQPVRMPAPRNRPGHGAPPPA